MLARDVRTIATKRGLGDMKMRDGMRVMGMSIGRSAAEVVRSQGGMRVAESIETLGGWDMRKEGGWEADISPSVSLKLGR
jgi:hypothetical protein